jgi:hypothetical protein
MWRYGTVRRAGSFDDIKPLDDYYKFQTQEEQVLFVFFPGIILKYEKNINICFIFNEEICVSSI